MERYDRILVMGIGNTLLRDEGVGCHVIARLLEEYDFPENVDVIDSGTMGMSILHLFNEYDYMLVVDAVDKTGQPPGSVMSFSPESIAPNNIMHSLHDMRFVDVLQNAKLMGWEPDAECIGIQIKDIEPPDFCEDLTPEVEASIPTAIEAVVTLLAEAGVTATKKPS